MENSQLVRLAAWIASTGFLATAFFQALLASGAPLGQLAWGGRFTRLPPGLRLSSLLSAVILAAAAVCVLERASVIHVMGRPRIVEVSVWILAGLSGLSTVGNLVSPSRLERRVMAPVALTLSCACVAVALGP
jgi:hypothetical protein